MKISKRVRRGYALVLALLLALPCLTLLPAQAADAIEVDRKCSLTVSVEGNYDEAFEADLSEMQIPVGLYRVSRADAVGRYTGVGSWASMKFDSISSATTAEDWTTLAEEAYGLIGDNQPSAQEKIEKRPGETASARFANLETGMYLVVPETTFNTDYSYEYTFTPYLTALPGNAYAQTGAGDDSWNYEPVIGLKAERVQQEGALNISKTLDTYNETLGATTCVFQVEGRDDAGNVVYSNVISATLEGAGSTETVKLTGIPAGIQVIVTEVYAGSNYQAVGPDTAETVIVSEAALENIDGASEASVSFTNAYNGGNRGGYGVTNHFNLDENGLWDWSTDLQE
ncbi:MAG: hypothetical protein K1W22_02320 [Lachnospiraceae bacterium]